MKKRMITVLAAAILFAMAVPGCVFAAETANAEKKTAEETQVQTPKDGFRVKNGKTYYYLNGKKVKKKWIEKDGKTYYFDKKGRMVRGKVKTKKTMYYFDDNGVFLHKIKIKKKMIALTYDDGPSAYTPMIVKELKKVGGRATFFVVGNRVNSYKKQMKEAFKAGCEIGNHSCQSCKSQYAQRFGDPEPDEQDEYCRQKGHGREACRDETAVWSEQQPGKRYGRHAPDHLECRYA